MTKRKKKPSGMSIDLPYGEFPFFDHEVVAAQTRRDNQIKEACAALCDEMVLYTGYDCAVAIRATKEPT